MSTIGGKSSDIYQFPLPMMQTCFGLLQAIWTIELRFLFIEKWRVNGDWGRRSRRDENKLRTDTVKATEITLMLRDKVGAEGRVWRLFDFHSPRLSGVQLRAIHMRFVVNIGAFARFE